MASSIAAPSFVDTNAAAAANDARLARGKAEGRVDADREAHSPDCVKFDQRAVDQATDALSRAQAQLQQVGSVQTKGSSASAGGALSILV